jgi:hypothetical protein
MRGRRQHRSEPENFPIWPAAFWSRSANQDAPQMAASYLNLGHFKALGFNKVLASLGHLFRHGHIGLLSAGKCLLQRETGFSRCWQMPPFWMGAQLVFNNISHLTHC